MTSIEHSAHGETESSRLLIEAGNRFEDAGDVLAALAKYQAAVAASPRWLRAYLNLGNALQRLGRTAEAVAALEAALRIDADFAPGHFNLGNVHLGAGNHAAAERELREALRLDPTMTHASIALANLLELLQRPTEAEQLLRQVLASMPNCTPACAPAAYNLGLLLQGRDDGDAAEQMFRACVDADPSFVAAYTALGDHTRNAGRAREAESWYRRGLAASPGAPTVWSSMLLSFLNRDDMPAAAILAEHLRFGAAFPEPQTARQARKKQAGEHPRLRVGYLSGDFIQHPVALFLRPVLMQHDRAKFELYCYSNNAKEDGMTREIRSHVDHWRNIAGDDDTTAAARIRADGLDVLVDLSGHSARSRLLLFNQGCAPVQASWLGYLNTTGLNAIDYRICDRHSDLVGTAEAFNVEKLQRLPDSQWCYAPVFDIPRISVPQRDAPDRVVFGSFNHASKFSDQCLDLWCRVLRAVPGSQLRIHAIPKGQATTALRLRVESRGIDPGRISIHPRTSIDAYFAAIGDVDIALDTFPYNGGTTTFDVLWMEVPLVALAGERPVSRSGVSILSTLQMPELIAESDDDYVAINAQLATDAGWRRSLRETLRQKMLQSPLMDAAKFTRNLEDAYRRMLMESRTA
ncbi:MAG: tetratricopeptide repeat protein [Betaproteobacteria bacterium]